MRIYQVDAFTDQPFHGNPACVCLLETERPDAWMQSFAGEMNLSETAFVRPGEGSFALRWFTPKREVSLCGHATLAAAHVLWEEQVLSPAEMAAFHTKSGVLTAQRDNGWIALDFPAKSVGPAEANPALNQALYVAPLYTHKASSPRGDLYLLEVATEEEVRAVSPDFGLLLASGARVVIVTSRSASADYDFVSRFFAPSIGINEDPVTGSAHCYLAPYWGARLRKARLVGLQASARTGVVRCHWVGERVTLRGKAITICKGELLI